MCGICGYSIPQGLRGRDEFIKKMTSSLIHRGPDEEGFYLEEGIALGHRRLKIIDLEKGHQPLSNERGTIWITYNGEIYNYLELKKELEARGHRFSTRSDTETIVHAYEEYGDEFIHKLNGMFAFAIWDSERKRLFLARDRLGIKPLFYAPLKGGGLAFSSEIKSFLHSDLIQPELDLPSLHLYLSFLYVPQPRTMFKGIKKLLPGHYAVYEKENLQVKRYWKLDFSASKEESKGVFHQYKDKILQLLKDAVKIRLVSEVPLGAFLSGGIDSSTLVALMSEMMDKPVKTFSIGFSEALYDESLYAQIVAEKFRTEHHHFVLQPRDLQELVGKLVDFFDEPFADASAIPTFLLSKVCRQEVTVALAGDGGDELFGGYPRYIYMKLWRYGNSLPEAIKQDLKTILPNSHLYSRKSLHKIIRFLHNFLQDSEDQYFYLMTAFKKEMKEALYSNPLKESFISYDEKAIIQGYLGETEDFINNLLHLDTETYLPNDLLTKVDITSMANSLEVRNPYLDYRLVEFMASLPSHWKLRGFRTKYILKSIAEEYLPKEIVHRPKKGFEVPLASWFRKELKDFIRDNLLEKSSLGKDFFNLDYIKELLERHQSGSWDYSFPLWALLNLELWYKKFFC